MYRLARQASKLSRGLAYTFAQTSELAGVSASTATASSSSQVSCPCVIRLIHSTTQFAWLYPVSNITIRIVTSTFSRYFYSRYIFLLALRPVRHGVPFHTIGLVRRLTACCVGFINRDSLYRCNQTGRILQIRWFGGHFWLHLSNSKTKECWFDLRWCDVQGYLSGLKYTPSVFGRSFAAVPSMTRCVVCSGVYTRRLCNPRYRTSRCRCTPKNRRQLQ